MDIGMLWYDDDAKRTLADKVGRAAEYYRAKYGQMPTTCYVNPALLNLYEGSQARVAGVLVKPNATVITNHFWLGISGKEL